MEPQRFDDMLMHILQDRKTITGFLDSIFGFLSRNTDFYYEQTDKNDKIGFPSGMKEQIVLKVLQKFDPKYRYVTEDSDVPPAITEVDVVSEDAQSCNEYQVIEDAKNTPPQPAIESTKKLFQSNDYINGNCFDSYCWSQTSMEIELHIQLPDGVKQVNTKIESDSIKVTTKLNPAVIFEGKLSAKCKHNDVLWTICDGKLNITLDKMKEAWWDRLIDGEPAINVSKIDSTKYIDELSPDSQAAIEKLRWEQAQKQAQKPTTLEKENIDRLREAWDTPGSPFKGQPFDPSLVKFN